MVGVLFVGIGLLILIPYQIVVPESIQDVYNSPRLFPSIVAYALIFLALIKIISILVKSRMQQVVPCLNDGHARKPREGDENCDTDDGELGAAESFPEKTDLRKLFLGLIVFGSATFLMPRIGFLLTAFFTILAMIYVFGHVAWYRAILFAAVTSFLIWYVFSEVLRVPLPQGFPGM